MDWQSKSISTVISSRWISNDHQYQLYFAIGGQTVDVNFNRIFSWVDRRSMLISTRDWLTSRLKNINQSTTPVCRFVLLTRGRGRWARGKRTVSAARQRIQARVQRILSFFGRWHSGPFFPLLLFLSFRDQTSPRSEIRQRRLVGVCARIMPLTSSLPSGSSSSFSFSLFFLLFSFLPPPPLCGLKTEKKLKISDQTTIYVWSQILRSNRVGDVQFQKN